MGNAGKVAHHKLVERDGLQVDGGQRLHRFGGLWALDGQERIGIRKVPHLGPELLVVFRNVFPVLINIGCIDHQQIRLILHPVHDQVIHDAALLVRQAAVLGAAHFEFGGIVGSDILDQVEGLWSLDQKLSHMRHVKDPYAFAHSLVFGIYPFVGNGHFIPRKGDHFCPEGSVCLGQGRFFHRFGFCCGKGIENSSEGSGLCRLPC